MISNHLELRVTTLEHQQRMLYKMMLDQQENVTQMVGFQTDVNNSHDKWLQDMQQRLEMGLMIQNQTTVFMKDIKHWMDELQRQANEAAPAADASAVWHLDLDGTVGTPTKHASKLGRDYVFGKLHLWTSISNF